MDKTAAAVLAAARQQAIVGLAALVPEGRILLAFLRVVAAAVRAAEHLEPMVPRARKAEGRTAETAAITRPERVAQRAIPTMGQQELSVAAAQALERQLMPPAVPADQAQSTPQRLVERQGQAAAAVAQRCCRGQRTPHSQAVRAAHMAAAVRAVQRTASAAGVRADPAARG